LQMLLPIFNTLTIHPAMLFLLWEMSGMGKDIRMAYFLKKLMLFFFDWCFNFTLRLYGNMPYATFYCGGPICKMTEFRMQIGVLALHAIVYSFNIIGFVMFGWESEDALEIGRVGHAFCGNYKVNVEECELKWMSDRGGRLFVYGAFGDPQYFKTGMFSSHGRSLCVNGFISELKMLGVTLLLIGPIPIILTIDSVRWLNTYRKVSMSNRTHQMTTQLLSVFLWQVRRFL
ncbi:hypothetical protein PENTCL1PPCAC_14530, partial [Pristionchus entomophagus]